MCTFNRGNILSIDDDEHLQIVLKEYLQNAGHSVLQAFTAQSALEKLESLDCDTVLLDLSLPDAQGPDLLMQIRKKTNAAIIVISGNSETTEKVVCLEMGADDYLIKPFEMRELTARIKAVSRRLEAKEEDSEQDNKKADILLFGEGWRLDRTQFQLFDKESRSADLTSSQFKLLEVLINASNRALSREYLFEVTHEGNYESYDRAIDIQVARLRQKLNDNKKPPEIIKTVRGVGYMFCGDVRAS